MIITIPYDYVAPDEDTGQIPEVPVPGTTNWWLQLVTYWCNLGYFMKPAPGNFVTLEFPPTGWLKEKNAFIPAPWAKALCDPDATLIGEIEGWQAVWQVHPDVYDQGLVPLTIPNSQYTDDQEITQQRLWKQWGSPNHTHYYLPTEAGPNAGITPDRYLIPTWSWGTDILGTEMMYGEAESGVNIVSRENFQQALNEGLLEEIPVTPTV